MSFQPMVWVMGWWVEKIKIPTSHPTTGMNARNKFPRYTPTTEDWTFYSNRKTSYSLHSINESGRPIVNSGVEFN